MKPKSQHGRGKTSRLAGALLVFCVLCPLRSTVSGQTLYDITFSQFAMGTVYTSASGAPNDFSSFTGEEGTGFVQVVNSYLGLTDQPLTLTEGGLATGIFGMNLGSASSNVITLNMQLMLDANAGAGVGFSGIAGILGTGVMLAFPTINKGIMQVESTDGTNYLSPNLLYSFSTNVDRSEVQNIQFTVNTLAHTFDLTVNDITLATNAPFGLSAPLNEADISLGDTSGQGSAGGGEAGIDNIIVTASAIPEPRPLTLVALALPLLWLLRQRKKRELPPPEFVGKPGATGLE